MDKKDLTDRRPDILEGAPLHYAPKNELGVVFLFSHMLKKLRLTIDKIQPQYPDCIAYQKDGSGQKKIRIEFEFKSRNFKSQKHTPKGCDWIVCWEHNWPDIPKHLKVVELRREFGLGFNIWIQPNWKDSVSDTGETLSDFDYSDNWSVPSLSHKDDLILYYYTSPDKYISNIFRLVSDVKIIEDTGFAPYFGNIRRVCHLKSPIFFEDLKRDRILKTSPFVRAQMQGSQSATEYWPYLFDMIIRRNSSVKKALAKYDPEKL